MLGDEEDPGPVGPFEVDRQAEIDVRVAQDVGGAVDVGEGDIQLRHLLQSANDRPADDVGEAHLAAVGQPAEVVVEDQAVDLEELRRHRAHRGGSGHREALVHAPGDHPGYATQRHGVVRHLGVLRCGRLRRFSGLGRGLAVTRVGGGWGRRLDGGRPGGDRLVAVGVSAVLEEAAPFFTDRSRRIEISFVHLLDQPVVTSGSGALEHWDNPIVGSTGP